MSSYESAKKLQEKIPGHFDNPFPRRAKKYWEIEKQIEYGIPEHRDEWENETVRVWMGKERGWEDINKNAYKILYHGNEEETKLRLIQIADLYNEWQHNNARDKKKKLLKQLESFIEEAKYAPFSEDHPSISFYSEKVAEAKKRWDINSKKLDSAKKKKKGGRTKKRRTKK